MLWLSRIRLRIRSLLRKEAADDALRQELEFHLAEQKAENVALGMSEGEAEAAARRAFGAVAAGEEEGRGQRRTGWGEDFLQDSRFVWRRVSKTPACFLVAWA